MKIINYLFRIVKKESMFAAYILGVFSMLSAWLVFAFFLLCITTSCTSHQHIGCEVAPVSTVTLDDYLKSLDNPDINLKKPQENGKVKNKTKLY